MLTMIKLYGGKSINPLLFIHLSIFVSLDFVQFLSFFLSFLDLNNEFLLYHISWQKIMANYQYRNNLKYWDR